MAFHRSLRRWQALSPAAAFLFFYLAGGMGGGDVKLITAVSCCAGLSHVTAILIATALAGGIFALALALVARTAKAYSLPM